MIQSIKMAISLVPAQMFLQNDSKLGLQSLQDSVKEHMCPISTPHKNPTKNTDLPALNNTPCKHFITTTYRARCL
jgi:hypothetical protein